MQPDAKVPSFFASRYRQLHIQKNHIQLPFLNLESILRVEALLLMSLLTIQMRVGISMSNEKVDLFASIEKMTLQSLNIHQ